MSRAEQAAAQLQRVKQLAEEHGPALRQAFAVLLEGALIGPAGARLFDGLAERHRGTRSDFYAAFDAVKDLAAEAEGGPPRIGDPYIPGPPRGGLRSSDVRGGSPGALHRLGQELDRAGRAWQETGQILSNILSGLGLNTSPAQNITRAGGWVAGQKHDITRRRDELLKSDQQQLLQATYGTVRGLAQALGQDDSRPLSKAWNDYAHRYLPGLWEGTKDIGLAGLATNPFTAPVYAMANPRSWIQRGPIGQFKGLIKGAQHPVAFAKAMINWDLWKSDPVRAYGQTVPSIIIGALTLGTGSGSGAASRFSTALRQTGKAKTPTADTGAAVRALDEAADQAGKTTSLGKQNTQTPPPPPSAANKPPKTPPTGDAGDVKLVGKGVSPPRPSPHPKETVYTTQKLREIADSVESFQEMLDRYGGNATGQVIGADARKQPPGSRKMRILERLGEIRGTQGQTVEVLLAASKRAFNNATTVRLPSGDVAVVPTQLQVLDTFIVSRDGIVTVRKTRRWYEGGDLRVEFID
ncbi:hypothetical protein [Actinomadura sp. 6N118]|uniref:hypothetical protein n=1 Tax=Actinomadura sp. 6N118 TaxID=3375151 RepID=UPI00379D66FE